MMESQRGECNLISPLIGGTLAWGVEDKLATSCIRAQLLDAEQHAYTLWVCCGGENQRESVRVSLHLGVSPLLSQARGCSHYRALFC